MLAEFQRPGVRRQRAGVDQAGARLGEHAFVGIGKLFVKLARQHQAEHGVAEKFEALVGLNGRALLVRDGRMREREPQQRGVGERVAEALLQCVEVVHGNLNYAGAAVSVTGAGGFKPCSSSAATSRWTSSN